MTDAFERGTPFNPMRFREELKSLDLSIARLELLFRQYKTCFGLKGHEALPEKIRDEAIYLKNLWQELENKLQNVEEGELPYYFLKKHIKMRAVRILEEVEIMEGCFTDKDLTKC